MTGSIGAVIVAAGEGRRLGAPVPKAFVSLAGKPMLMHSIAVFCSHSEIERVIVVVPENMMDETISLLNNRKCLKQVNVEAGGAQRWQSVHNGVLSAKTDWVLVHDAARPFLDESVINALLAKRDSFKCAITGTPAVDTMRTFEGDRCIATIDRSNLVRVGTPQMFHRQTLLDAISRIQVTAMPPTDEAMLMEQSGIEVGLAWGNPINFKITTSQDLEMAEAIFALRSKKLKSKVRKRK
jgi:2-C-methyl-D-erythritol 4-phosphate cytidylyltransferase